MAQTGNIPSPRKVNNNFLGEINVEQQTDGEVQGKCYCMCIA